MEEYKCNPEYDKFFVLALVLLVLAGVIIGMIGH